MSTGEPGSPLIICSAAEKNAKGKYSVFFVKKKEREHQELTAILDAGGYLTSAKTIFGDALYQLRRLTENLGDETLFLYIDPFGLDVEFDVLQPLLDRDNSYSTEILINLNMPGIHRLASRNAWLSGQGNRNAIEGHHEKLTRTLGGDYWKEVLLDISETDTKVREARLVSLYRERLSSTGYLKYTGACPVRERVESQTKYHMVFASPHHDSIVLLNDSMCRSFQKYMHDQWAKDTYFADSPWTEWRDPQLSQSVALQYVSDYIGDTREELWRRIVLDHFMLYTESEFISAIKFLLDSGKIECITPIEKGGIRPTRRLNKNCVFKLSETRTLF